MRLGVGQCRERLAAARHAVLVTVGTDGRPHAVPIVFAPDGDRLLTAVDGKPKSTTALRRLDNLRAQPRAAVLAEHYEEDWTRLWWVRADVVAQLPDPDGRAARDDLELLARRYPQYRGTPPAGPLIVLHVQSWTGWSFSDDPSGDPAG